MIYNVIKLNSKDIVTINNAVKSNDLNDSRIQCVKIHVNLLKKAHLKKTLKTIRRFNEARL